MDVIGVKVTAISGATRTYTSGRAIEVDGYGDYRILNEDGALVATRRRAQVAEIELIYSE